MKFNSELELASFFSTYQVWYNDGTLDFEVVTYINSIYKYSANTEWVLDSEGIWTTRIPIDQGAGQYTQKITKKHFSPLKTDLPISGEDIKFKVIVETSLNENLPEEDDEVIIVVEDPDPGEG